MKEEIEDGGASGSADSEFFSNRRADERIQEHCLRDDRRHRAGARLVETYVDAAAVEAHFMGSVVQQMVPKLAAVCAVDGFEFYGDPGPKVSAMAAGFGAQFYKYWMGIGR